MSAVPPRLRIGILGCSDIARRRFLPAMMKARNAKLVACASRTIEKARSFFPGADYEALGYDELLARDAVDAVYISLPNHLHEEWTVKALARGKHVICEKPLGLSAEAVGRMTAYAEQQDLLLYENIAYLHHPLHSEAKRIVGRGDIGRIRTFRSSFGFTIDAERSFRMSSRPGGGAFQDQARYPLSAAIFYLHGKLTRFSGYAQFRKGVNVGVNVCGASSAGENFCCTIGFEQHYECWYELIGDRGLLRVDRAYTTPRDRVSVIEVTSGPHVERTAVPASDHFQLMIEKVASLIERRQGFSDAHRNAVRLAAAADLLWAGCAPIAPETDQ